MENKEIWKPITGFDGYEVSNFGRIISYRRKNPVILKPTINRSGYAVGILVGKDKKQVNVRFHVIVAKEFVPNPLNKPQVNHIDGNKLNNCASNLEWVTPSENIKHAFALGLKESPNKGVTGEDHYASKPVLQYDMNGLFVKKWSCYSDASRFYHINPCTICNCLSGHIKSASGFIWKRCDSEEIPNKIDIPYNRKHPKKIYQYTTDGTLVRIWNSYKEIEQDGTYERRCVSSCCHGKSKTSYGYIWKFEYI